MGLQREIGLVRELLERLFDANVATSVLFDALSTWGKGVPDDADQVLELVRGPLRVSLNQLLGADAEEPLAALEQQLLQISESVELELEIDLDDGTDEGAMTAQMLAVSQPVIVLILAGYPEFAQRLTASIGIERVHTLTVGDVTELRHATFSSDPLFVVVDASKPPAVRAVDVAKSIRGLPDAIVAVVWGEETSYGRELRLRIEERGTRALYLDRNEGIEPLLDLILSRFKVSTIPPPMP